MRTLGAAVAIATVPVVALLIMALAGRAAIGPALLASGVTLLAAFALALFWSRDLDVLAETLRQVGADEPTGRPTREIMLPGMQRLGRAAGRLGRRGGGPAGLGGEVPRTEGA